MFRNISKLDISAISSKLFRLGFSERLRRSCQSSDVTRRVASLGHCRGTPLQLRASSWSLDSAMHCPPVDYQRTSGTHIHISIYIHMRESLSFLLSLSAFLAHYYIFLYLHLRLVYFTRFYISAAQMLSVSTFPSRVTWMFKLWQTCGKLARALSGLSVNASLDIRVNISYYICIYVYLALSKFSIVCHKFYWSKYLHLISLSFPSTW